MLALLPNQTEKRPANTHPATPPPTTRPRTTDPAEISIDSLDIQNDTAASTPEDFKAILSKMNPHKVQNLLKAMIDHDGSAMEMDDTQGNDA